MQKVTLDKISSVTKNLKLPQTVKVTEDFSPKSGLVVVGKVATEKEKYNKLELASGQFSTLKKGDIVALALGERQALRGFAGYVPKTLKPKSKISVLNKGGVAGNCSSSNQKK